MRCYICDTALATPNFNKDHGDYEPCERCLIVIQDTIGAFIDKPSADEDDLGGSGFDWPYPSAHVPPSANDNFERMYDFT